MIIWNRNKEVSHTCRSKHEL